MDCRLFCLQVAALCVLSFLMRGLASVSKLHGLLCTWVHLVEGALAWLTEFLLQRELQQ